jgi:hypothetical protein
LSLLLLNVPVSADTAAVEGPSSADWSPKMFIVF